MKKPNERFWDNWGRFVSVIGILTSVVVVVFGFGSDWNEVHAYGGRIKTLEDWKVQEAQDVAVMRYKIDRMYDEIVPQKKVP